LEGGCRKDELQASLGYIVRSVSKTKPEGGGGVWRKKMREKKKKRKKNKESLRYGSSGRQPDYQV
jgi:hypothetical protein